MFKFIYLLFKEKIKNCPVNFHKIRKGDFCINTQHCYEKKLKLPRNGFVLSRKSKVCQCKENHTYECGQSICTKSDKACNFFKQK